MQFNTRAAVLRNGKFDGDEEEKFAEYYNRSLFPNVTWYKPANRQSPNDVIVKLRNDLKACDRPGADERQVFNKLADLTLEYMTEVAGNSRCHPAARVNATLAIGKVNSPKAAKVLLDMAFARVQVFAIRVAAMTGLVRMAGPTGKGVLTADPTIESQVITRMVAFVQKQKRDDGMSWMRGQAADVLADLGTTDAQGDVSKALLIMLNDKDLPVPLRSKAARGLGKLKYGDSPPAADAMTALAEFAREAFSSDQPADRARVRLVIRDVEEGLKPFVKSSNDQTLSDGLKKILHGLDKETEDKMGVDELKTAITSAKDALDGLLNKKP